MVRCNKTVRCTKWCVAPNGALHQMVRCAKWCVAPNGALHQEGRRYKSNMLVNIPSQDVSVCSCVLVAEERTWGCLVIS